MQEKKLSPKAVLEAKIDALVAELQAIRGHIANKRAASSSPEELADLQTRLFEVWVAEKLAVTICQQEQTTRELTAAKQDAIELRKDLALVVREVARLGKLTEKLSTKLASKKPSRKQ